LLNVKLRFAFHAGGLLRAHDCCHVLYRYPYLDSPRKFLRWASKNTGLPLAFTYSERAFCRPTRDIRGSRKRFYRESRVGPGQAAHPLGPSVSKVERRESQKRRADSIGGRVNQNAFSVSSVNFVIQDRFPQNQSEGGLGVVAELFLRFSAQCPPRRALTFGHIDVWYGESRQPSPARGEEPMMGGYVRDI